MRRRLFWRGLIGSGHLLLDRSIVLAIAARIPTRLRPTLWCFLQVVNIEAVLTTTCFPYETELKAAVGHGGIVVWQPAPMGCSAHRRASSRRVMSNRLLDNTFRFRLQRSCLRGVDSEQRGHESRNFHVWSEPTPADWAATSA